MSLGYQAFYFAICVTLIALGGAYLRCLPFVQVIDDATRKNLIRNILLCAVFLFLICLFSFSRFDEITITVYKRHLAFVWFPFFILTVLTIRGQYARHIFVLGMQVLFYYMTHTVANTFLLYAYLPGTPQIVAMQPIFYLVTFACLLPLARHCFSRLLPSPRLIGELPYGYCVAFLPIAITMCQINLYMGNLFVPLHHAPMRLFNFAGFILLYKFVTLERTEQDKAIAEIKKRELIRQQISKLNESVRVMQESYRQVSVIRHDIRHSVRLIYDLNEEGLRDEIRAYLLSIDATLKKSATTHLAADPIINATLAIYLGRAKSLGISERHEINFGVTLELADSQMLAIVIANLIDNAIAASMRQPEGRRGISVTLRASEARGVGETSGDAEVVFIVENKFDEPIPIGDDGLPSASVDGDLTAVHDEKEPGGHGVGMMSVREFAKKCDASLSFTHEDGIATFMMYCTMKKK